MPKSVNRAEKLSAVGGEDSVTMAQGVRAQCGQRVDRCSVCLAHKVNLSTEFPKVCVQNTLASIFEKKGDCVSFV